VQRTTGTSELNFHTESSTTTLTTATAPSACFRPVQPSLALAASKKYSLFLVIFNLKSLTKRLKEGSRRYRGGSVAQQQQQRISTARARSL